MSEPTEPVALIDSNVLVHAYNDSSPEKHSLAWSLLQTCWQKEAVYAVSVQNLTEFFVVVTKKVPNPLSVEQAEQIIADLTSFSHWRILRQDENTLKTAVSLYKVKKGHFWDALLVATMMEQGIISVYTEDVDDFERLGVTARNPFAPP